MPYQTRVISDTTVGYTSAPSFQLAWRDIGPTYCIKNFNLSPAQTVIFKANFRMNFADGNGSNGKWSNACLLVSNSKTGAGAYVAVVSTDNSGDNYSGNYNFIIGLNKSFSDNEGQGTSYATKSVTLGVNTWFRMEVTQTVDSSGIATIAAVIKNAAGDTTISTLSASFSYVRGEYVGFNGINYGQHDNLLYTWYDNIDVIAYGSAPQGTNATATGGGGGGGCVASTMYIDHERIASQINIGDLIDSSDYQPDVIVKRKVQANAKTPQPCYRIVTISGIVLVASAYTPFTLKDGSTKFLPDMLNEYVLVDDDGVLRWEEIISNTFVGELEVVKISIGGHSYFAGEISNRRICSHNVAKA